MSTLKENCETLILTTPRCSFLPWDYNVNSFTEDPVPTYIESERCEVPEIHSFQPKINRESVVESPGK